MTEDITEQALLQGQGQGQQSKPHFTVRVQWLSPIEAQFQIKCPAAERSIFLLGTAHISQKSRQQTEEKIAELEPDCICVELDQQRFENLRQHKRWQDLDLYKVLKEGKGFLLLVNLLLASFQRRIGRDLQMRPGQEMIRAVQLAEERGAHLELVDRPIEVTLKRAWAACGLWQRAKLLNSLLASLFLREDISEEEIEGLKEASSMEQMMEEFAQYLPSIKVSLIDERDIFLARSILNAPGKNTFAVLGAGHLKGVCHTIEKILGSSGATILREASPPDSEKTAAPDLLPVDPIAKNGAEDGAQDGDAQPPPPSPPWPAKTQELQAEKQSKDSGQMEGRGNGEPHKQGPAGEGRPAIPSLQALLQTPPKGRLARFLPWLVPLVALGILAAGFFWADPEKALHGLWIWVWAHSALAGLAAILVLAHPLSVLVAALSAPFTALNPTISVGLVTALAEILLRKPRVGDVEGLLELEHWWEFRKNRIWHALVIFFIVSLGGSIATFVALPWLTVLLSRA